MNNNSYLEYCEGIWNGWLNEKGSEEDELREYFDLQYCPEPYLRFIKNNESTKQIYFLTTNPGQGFDQQERTIVLNGKSIIKSNMTYENTSKNLADYYKENLIKGSKYRIDHMEYLSQKCGYDNFIQIESIPYHSKNIIKKDDLLKLIKNGDSSINNYIDKVKEYLSDKNVIAIQAGNSEDIKKLTDWNKLQSSLIGMDIEKSKYVSLKVNDKNKDTIGMYIEKQNGSIKILCIRAGQNDLPGSNGCDIIANEYSKLLD